MANWLSKSLIIHIFTFLFFVLPASGFYTKMKGAIIVVEKSDIDLDMIPCLSIHRFGIIDKKLDEVVYPEVDGNKLIYQIEYIAQPQYISFDSFGVGLMPQAIFIASRGDSVIIQIDNQDINFKGKGAEPYECIYKLKLAEITFYQEHNLSSSQVQSSHEVLKKILHLHRVKENILNDYDNYIREDIYDMILNNMQISFNMKLYDTLSRTKDRNSEEIGKLGSNLMEIDSTRISYLYPFYFIQKYRYHQLKVMNAKFDFNQCFEYIDNNYSGIIKEQLIGHLLSKELRSSTVDKSHLDVIYSFVHEPIKSYCLTLIHGKIAGIEAPEFKLLGLDNNYYTLDDFQGRIVIMDFWFTGCGACKLLVPHIGKIAKSFGDRDDVVFLSICVDRDLEKWRESVRGNEYTFDNSIKLSTDGQGYSHPIIKDYNVKGYPTVIGVSKSGNILPIPFSPIIDNGQSLTELIYNELNNNSFLN